MIKFSIEYSPVAEKIIKALPKDFEKGTLVGLRKSMLHIEGESKKIFAESGPVKPKILTARTGNLRRSIIGDIESQRVGILYTKVSYGRIHELLGAGKAKITRPFLRPAIESSFDKVREIIIDSITKEMK